MAYRYFLWVVSVTLCNNAYWIFEPFQVRRCNHRAEIKQLMCDIAVCIAKVQDNAEMDWLVYIYEIKLGTSFVSLSTVYCKFDFLYMCAVFYKHVYVFSVFVGDCKLIFVHLII